MEYLNLEEEYKKIFDEEVLPFINKHIKKDFCSLPVYHLLEGLKINRFRGALPIIVAKEYGIDPKIMLPLSAFCELTFTTAMVQDDYYDGDDSREGLAAAHKVFGIKEALISCDYVNHKIISIVNNSLVKNKFSESVRNRLLEIMNDGMRAWYLSVILEDHSKKDLLDVNEKYLEEIYLSKTIHGRMLLECTFLMVQNNPEMLSCISEYSKHLALAGQLKNDIYDFTKHRIHRGLSDLRQGHMTWPLYLLINSLQESGKKDLLNDLKNKDYEKVISLYREKKIIEKTVDLINDHVEKAKLVIKNKFPEKVQALLETWAEGNRNFSKEPKI